MDDILVNNRECLCHLPMFSLILMMICDVENVMKRVGERRKFNYGGMLAWPRPIWPVGAGWGTDRPLAPYVHTTTAVPRLRISLRRLISYTCDSTFIYNRTRTLHSGGHDDFESI